MALNGTETFSISFTVHLNLTPVCHEALNFKMCWSWGIWGVGGGGGGGGGGGKKICRETS